MDGPAELVQRLVDATNARDIDALVDCFVDDYVNETPSHPGRGFRGRGQVRSNWEQIFEVRDGRAVSARFYLEPVHDDGALVDDAVHSQVTRDSADAS